MPVRPVKNMDANRSQLTRGINDLKFSEAISKSLNDEIVFEYSIMLFFSLQKEKYQKQVNNKLNVFN